MALLGQSEIDAMVNAARAGGAQKTSSARKREIRPCNFRSAAQLSNEGARHLTALHETFARLTTTELDLFLGAPMDVKLISLEQLAARDYIAGVSPSGYLLPYTIAPMQGKMIMELDNELLFSIIDLLLGGTGKAALISRELTELDEELLKSITTVIVGRLELAWKSEGVALIPEHSIKPAVAIQVFPPEAEVVLLMFEVSVAGLTGSLNIVFPHSFATFLLRNTQASTSKKRATDPHASKLGFRNRMLECNFVISTEMPHLLVPVRELIDLKVGTVLKLRAPVSTPVKLTIEHHDLFQVTPVRNGSRKAAQLGASIVAAPMEMGAGRTTSGTRPQA